MKKSNSPIARQVVKSAKRLGLDRVLNVIQDTNRIKIQDLEALKQDPLPQQIKSRLFTFYKEDINRLERLIERDLSHWKEDV